MFKILAITESQLESPLDHKNSGGHKLCTTEQLAKSLIFRRHSAVVPASLFSPSQIVNSSVSSLPHSRAWQYSPAGLSPVLPKPAWLIGSVLKFQQRR
jgi:hypothetical protein